MKAPCGVVKDLLPLYCDGVCGEESKALVEEHLEECEACREEYQKLREGETAQAQAEEEQKKAEALKQVKKKLRRKRMAAAALATFIFAIVCAGAGLWMNTATVNVDVEGLVERVEYDPDPPEWTKEPNAVEETGLTQEELDHFGGRLKLELSQDSHTGIGYSVCPVKLDGKTQTVMILYIRRTVWDFLTYHAEESWTGYTYDLDVGGQAWPVLFSEDGEYNGEYSESYHGERGYYYVDQGFYTKEELEAMRYDDCVVDALYYLPYSAAKDFSKVSSEEAAKRIEEKAALLWQKEK